LVSLIFKEVSPPHRLFEHIVLWESDYLHNQTQLFMFAFTWKDGHACIKFNQNTAQAPHIDGRSVRNAKNDFWGSIESGLDVSINALVRKSGAAKVNYLNATPILALQKYVFWLEIAVDDVLRDEVAEGLQYLDCKLSNQTQPHTLETVSLNELIKVNAEKFKRNDEVFSEVAVVFDHNNVVLVMRIVFF